MKMPSDDGKYYVFHRDGRRFKDVKTAFSPAVKRAGLHAHLRPEKRRKAMKVLERAMVSHELGTSFQNSPSKKVEEKNVTI